jgi:hypothetical protein
MTIQQKKTFTNNRSSKSKVLALAAVLAASAALVPGAEENEHAHAAHRGSAPAKLVETVRNATSQYQDAEVAKRAGYQPAFGCISGPDHGAMGVHFINGVLVGDGEIEASRPEALIYEPFNGGMRLVGVEYIVDAATWLARHDNTPPMLEGQGFQFVNSPNRYGIPAFFELHVWAWRDNPNGSFVDWNTRVTCEGQQ